jgi:hypothetical protein
MLAHRDAQCRFTRALLTRPYRKISLADFSRPEFLTRLK